MLFFALLTRETAELINKFPPNDTNENKNVNQAGELSERGCIRLHKTTAAAGVSVTGD
jgi:hypothetical protein